MMLMEEFFSKIGNPFVKKELARMTLTGFKAGYHNHRGKSASRSARK
jgi:hypothetical protein